MDTQVRTPQTAFTQPQRLTVPLFQRPYAWREDTQWEPLWNDVLRVASRLLDKPQGPHQPHFLGAVVVQQLSTSMGSMGERTIIDGQQRLTTLQILLDALHAELHAAGALQAAQRIEPLVANPEAFCSRPEDRFKVWPTNKDQAAWTAVMSAEPPLSYETFDMKSLLVQAHEFFALKAREWLQADPGNLQARAEAVERTVRDLIQIVVIELTTDENAQEIFETLNARGAPLTAADLIKNFVFQRLTDASIDVHKAYEDHWKKFETGFWEAEISAGRVLHHRSSMFLNHWLIARTGKEVLARKVFDRFKEYASFEAGVPMIELLGQIDRAADVYRAFIDGAKLTGKIDRVNLFAYRTGVLESEVVKPLVLFLLDPDEKAIPPDQLNKALDVTESWLVRRMLVRTTSKSYSQIVVELITKIRKVGRESAGDIVEDVLRGQTGTNAYWPDNDDLATAITSLQAYRRLSRGRLRMILEAIEDHERGWFGKKKGLGGERVARGAYAIEHVMPRRWQTSWPLPISQTAAERDSLLDTLGNLTLLDGRLNSKVSNGPWTGPAGKRAALTKHDVLMLNRQLCDNGRYGWTHDTIRTRTQDLLDTIIAVWPVPAGHTARVNPVVLRPRRRIGLADLVGADLIHEGATLFSRRKKFSDRTATVLLDGGIDVDGVRYATPSSAARAVTGHSENGWYFWLVDAHSQRSLMDAWHEYAEQRDADADIDDEENDLDDGPDEDD